MSRPVAPFPTYDRGVPLDLRRPMTLEEMVEDCVEKLREDAKETPQRTIEIVIGTEAMLDLALRVMALEARLGPISKYLRDVEGDQE